MTESFVNPDVAPSGPGCLDCTEAGTWWFHLRRCAECGHIGCCDDSLNRHARVHAIDTGHRVMQSYEPGEEWFWDFTTEELFAGPELAPPTQHPESQTVPGPSDRVPTDWLAQLQNRPDPL